MFKLKLKIIYLFSLCLLFACGKESQWNSVKAPEVNSEEAFSILKKVAGITPRHSGTDGAKKTVDFITHKAGEIGYIAQKDTWVENTPAGEIEFCNVMVDIPGKSDEFILVGCHYDTKKIISVPNFAGANDGASGVGLLLSMMAAIKNFHSPPPASLKFVFFDGEECFNNYNENDGLFGSRRLAAKMAADESLKKCLAVVILDMIGDQDLKVTLPSGSDKRLADQLLKIAAKQGVSKHFTVHETDIIDDHTPFQKKNIPVIDLIDFDFGSSNRYWHTSADTVDKTSPESLKITGNAALQLLWDIPHIL